MIRNVLKIIPYVVIIILLFMYLNFRKAYNSEIYHYKQERIVLNNIIDSLFIVLQTQPVETVLVEKKIIQKVVHRDTVVLIDSLYYITYFPYADEKLTARISVFAPTIADSVGLVYRINPTALSPPGLYPIKPIKVYKPEIKNDNFYKGLFLGVAGISTAYLLYKGNNKIRLTIGGLFLTYVIKKIWENRHANHNDFRNLYLLDDSRYPGRIP